VDGKDEQGCVQGTFLSDNYINIRCNNLYGVFKHVSLQGWRFSKAGKNRYYPINSRLHVTSTEAAVDSAVNHMGLAQVLSYQAASQIRAGKLRLVLNDYISSESPVSFVYPQGRMVPVKLRSFIDFASPIISKRLKQVAEDCGLI